MIRLKSIYAVQRKIGKSKNWEITYWGADGLLASCQFGVKKAQGLYPDEIYRIIKIHKQYEVIKF